MAKPSLIDNIDVIRLDHDPAIAALLNNFDLQLGTTPPNQPIPGSYWGDDEAGLIGRRVYARTDTPLHSVLHEACHYICMPGTRRAQLHTNAGGGYDEENAVCYLSILLSDQLPRLGRQRMMCDMDRWGYSFRLGSTERWFEDDADDARQQLLDWGLINFPDQLTYRVRP